MRKMLVALVLLALASWVRASVPSQLDVIIMVGAPGEASYREVFARGVQDWISACRKAGKTFRVLESAEGETNQIQEVKEVLGQQAQGEQELWIVFLGHGTFDGLEAKFNLSGPDLSAKELGAALPAERPVILFNTTASSAPFINALSHPSRIIVAATRSGWEENFTRFGEFLPRTICDPAADLDKDGQVSVLETFLMTSRRVEDFYKSERRLATEHALLDDNGDGKGTPASFFSGVRPAKKPEEAANVDGFRAHQLHFLPNEAEAKLSPAMRKRRNELELNLEKVRARKQQMKEEDYLKEIEPILLDLSKLYRDAEGSSGSQEATP